MSVHSGYLPHLSYNAVIWFSPCSHLQVMATGWCRHPLRRLGKTNYNTKKQKSPKGFGQWWWIEKDTLRFLPCFIMFTTHIKKTNPFSLTKWLRSSTLPALINLFPTLVAKKAKAQLYSSSSTGLLYVRWEWQRNRDDAWNLIRQNKAKRRQKRPEVFGLSVYHNETNLKFDSVEKEHPSTQSYIFFCAGVISVTIPRVVEIASFSRRQVWRLGRLLFFA